MGIYKITNITNTLSKSNNRYNTNIEINIKNGVLANKTIIKPGQLIFVNYIQQIPAAVNILKLRGYILIENSSDYEYNQFNNKPKSISSRKENDTKIDEPIQLLETIVEPNIVEIQAIDELIEVVDNTEIIKPTKKNSKKDKEIE